MNRAVILTRIVNKRETPCWNMAIRRVENHGKINRLYII